MARILVTGASGFIGTALVPRLLAAGHRPVALVRRQPETSWAGAVEVVSGDLAEAASLHKAVAGAEIVVHLGAATSAAGLDSVVAHRVNVGGATALIEACRAARCQRVIVLSTQHVHLPQPGLYGRTKRIADRLFEASGLAVTILRPSLVYGPGSRGVFVKLAGLVRRLPIIPIIGPGTWRLRPLYLPDLLSLILAVIDRSDRAGPTYDVGGPDAVTYVEFVAAMCAAMGRPFRRLHLPIGLSFLLAAGFERAFKNPPLTTDNVHGATLEAPCDLRALLRDFAPTLTPLAAGLGQTFAEGA